MVNTADLWHALIDCYGQHRRPRLYSRATIAASGATDTITQMLWDLVSNPRGWVSKASSGRRRNKKRPPVITKAQRLRIWDLVDKYSPPGDCDGEQNIPIRPVANSTGRLWSAPQEESASSNGLFMANTAGQ